MEPGTTPIRYSFDRARVLLSEPSPIFHGALRSVLHSLGFRQFISLKSVPALRAELSTTDFDLWITNAAVEEGEVFRLVHDVRHGRTRRNMFIPIIVQSPHVTEALAHRMLESGADRLWRLPVTGAQIREGIEMIMHSPRIFAVSANYIGPHCRHLPHQDDATLPQKPVAVPNPLRAKALPGTVRVSNSDALHSIHEQKVEHIARQLGRLMDCMAPLLRVDPASTEAHRMLDRFLVLADDLAGRVPATRHRERSSHCRAVLQKARQPSDAPDRAHVDTLARLVAAERAAILSGDSGPRRA